MKEIEQQQRRCLYTIIIIIALARRRHRRRRPQTPDVFNVGENNAFTQYCDVHVKRYT